MLPSLVLGAIGKKLLQGSKNVIANGIRHGMGTVGGFLADRIQKDESDNPTLKKSKKTETPKSQNTTEINAKAVASIEQMGKQVSDAINVTIRTTNKGFVFVNRYMDHYGENVSRSLESLGNLLTRLLYERQKKTAPQSILLSGNKKKDDDDGFSWAGILGALYTAKKVVSFLRNTSILSKLLGKKTAVEILKKPGILKSLLSPVFNPFKFIAKGFLKALVPVDVALSAFNFTEAFNRDPNKETAGDILGDYGWTALTGAAAGGTLGAMAGPVGAFAGALVGGAAGIITMFYNRSYRKNGGVNSINISKIIFDANKIKFDALNTLEFKKRFLDDGNKAGTLNKLADKMIGGRGGAGFFNHMLDEAVDSVKQRGVFGAINNILRGGPGGAGTLNGMADRAFGTGKNKTTPLEHPRSVDTTAAPKGLAELRGIKGKANFMHGQYGEVGTNQTTITLNSGKKVTVNSASAEAFTGFLNELEASGYKIDSVAGLSMRQKRMGRGWSQHAYGNAIDINPSKNLQNGTGKTDMPANVRDMAAKYGLSWGGDWSRKYNDPMHFEWNGLPTLSPDEIKKLEQKSKPSDKPTEQVSKPMSFGDIPPALNDAASKDQTIPWKNGYWWSKKDSDWSWMKKSDNIDDRRNQPDPYKDDQYSIAEKEKQASFDSFLSYMTNKTAPLPSQTLLGKQLGVDKLNPIEKPVDLGITVRPSNVPDNTTRPKEEKQSSYQGLLDQRSEKRVYDTNTFANYFATENNLGEA